MRHLCVTSERAVRTDHARSLGCHTETITKGSTNYPYLGVRARFNRTMDRAKHLASAAAADAAQAASSVLRVVPGSGHDGPSSPIEGRSIDSRVALVDEELSKLRKRHRARELALAQMAGALATLRRANRALTDENALLRQQVAELKERPPRRVIARGPRVPVSGGE